ncbi:hypothetical protein V8E36_004457 [Tilletia maclaganii]
MSDKTDRGWRCDLCRCLGQNQSCKYDGDPQQSTAVGCYNCQVNKVECSFLYEFGMHLSTPLYLAPRDILFYPRASDSSRKRKRSGKDAGDDQEQEETPPRTADNPTWLVFQPDSKAYLRACDDQPTEEQRQLMQLRDSKAGKKSSILASNHSGQKRKMNSASKAHSGSGETGILASSKSEQKRRMKSPKAPSQPEMVERGVQTDPLPSFGTLDAMHTITVTRSFTIGSAELDALAQQRGWQLPNLATASSNDRVMFVQKDGSIACPGPPESSRSPFSSRSGPSSRSNGLPASLFRDAEPTASTTSYDTSAAGPLAPILAFRPPDPARFTNRRKSQPSAGPSTATSGSNNMPNGFGHASSSSSSAFLPSAQGRSHTLYEGPPES